VNLSYLANFFIFLNYKFLLSYKLLSNFLILVNSELLKPDLNISKLYKSIRKQYCLKINENVETRHALSLRISYLSISSYFFKIIKNNFATF